MKPRLVESYKAVCCGTETTFSEKYEAVKFLLTHVQTAHKQFYKQLEKKGRQLARSQNGCGYYDGSDRDTGWAKARAGFREAWIKHALEDELEGRE